VSKNASQAHCIARRLSFHQYFFSIFPFVEDYRQRSTNIRHKVKETMNYGHHVRDLLLELKRSEEAMITATTNITQQDTSKIASVAIPSYNNLSVHNSIQDFKLHLQALQEQAEAAAAVANSQSRSSTSSGGGGGNNSTNKPSLNVRPSILLQNAACQRNKRGLLLYHIVRMQRIQDLLYWQSSDLSSITRSNDMVRNELRTTTASNGYSGDNNNDTAAETVLQNLCPSEKEFLREYQQLISNYCCVDQQLTDVSIVDLRAHCTVPPITVDRIVCRVIDTTPFQTTSNDDGTDPENKEQSNSNTIVLESGQCVNFTLGSTHYLMYSDCEEYIRCGALQVIQSEET
jgi:hypothetical protein